MKLDLPGVKSVRYRAADGTVRVYLYHRPTGERLPDDPVALLERVRELDETRPVIGHHAPGSVGALIAEYKASPDFKQLAPKSQKDYRRHLDTLGEIWGKRTAPSITAVHVTRLRDQFAETPRTANYIVQILRLLLEFGRRTGYVTHNPAVRPKLLRTGDGHRPAEEEEIAHFRERWAPATLERVAFELTLNSGQRGEDRHIAM